MVKKMRTGLQEFIALESSAGIILFGAALLAMVAINRMYRPYYLGFLDIPGAVPFRRTGNRQTGGAVDQ